MNGMNKSVGSILPHKILKLLCKSLNREIRRKIIFYGTMKKGAVHCQKWLQISLEIKVPGLPFQLLNFLLWSLSIPAKVKIFLWRAVHNFLPTRSRLASENIIRSSQCQRCSNFSEDVTHALVSCRSAWKTWKSSFLAEVLTNKRSYDLFTLVREVSWPLNKQEFEIFVTAAWLN